MAGIQRGEGFSVGIDFIWMEIALILISKRRRLIDLAFMLNLTSMNIDIDFAKSRRNAFHQGRIECEFGGHPCPVQLQPNIIGSIRIESILI
jgi:hypothetical protein